MSGTCFAESDEFKTMFGVNVLKVPTHKPLIREDLKDRIYNTLEEKTYAIIEEVKEANRKLQPVLLITNSVESSEYFEEKLQKAKIKFLFLNAKHAKEEAEIIADAGKPGAVVIATNMAGRGTDIQLGGNLLVEIQKLKDKNLKQEEYEARLEEIKNKIIEDKKTVINAGGLYVIGTERNENSRVDLQARGRSGRQGDPGKSLFFLSFDDALIRRFVQVDSLRAIGEKFNIFKKNQVIEDDMMINQMKSFQQEVEAIERESRKNFTKFENIEDLQRKVFYAFRRDILNSINIKEKILKTVNSKSSSPIHEDQLKDNYMYVTYYLLEILDTLWKKYLIEISCVKEGIYLSASSGKDIYISYQDQVIELFKQLLNDFDKKSYNVMINYIK